MTYRELRKDWLLLNINNGVHNVQILTLTLETITAKCKLALGPAKWVFAIEISQLYTVHVKIEYYLLQ